MCELCDQQAAQPAGVIRNNVEILSGLTLRNDVDRGTRRDAVNAIRRQTDRMETENREANAEIVRLRAENERLRRENERIAGERDEQRKAKQTAQTVASNTQVMAYVVRDLTVLFKSVGVNVDLEFEQADQAGYEFRVTGYKALDMTVDLRGYSTTVRNKARRRKARSYYIGREGLSADALTGIEALFPEVMLAKSNTPACVHGELFEADDESDQGPRITFGVMVGPDCGNPNCKVHNGSGEVPAELRAFAESLGAALGATGVHIVPAGSGFFGSTATEV